MNYIGETNGTELYHGEDNPITAEFISGKWDCNMFCLIEPWQLTDMREALITTQSTQKCFTGARAFMAKICPYELFSQIPPELLNIITLHFSACCPWQIHPIRELEIPWRLDQFDVTNMIPCPVSRLSIFTARHVVHAIGPVESYSGVLAYRCESIVTRTEYNSKIEWSSGPPNLVYCSLAQIMLEAKRKEILGIKKMILPGQH